MFSIQWLALLVVGLLPRDGALERTTPYTIAITDIYSGSATGPQHQTVAQETHQWAEPDSQRELQPDAQRDLQPDAQRNLQPDAQTDLQPDAQKDFQPDARRDLQPDAQTERQLHPERASRPSYRWSHRRVPRPTSRWGHRRDSRPTSQWSHRWASQSTSRSVTQWVPESTTQPVSQWVSEPTSRPVLQWGPESTSRPVPQWGPESTSRPVLQWGPESTSRPVTQWGTGCTSRPVTQWGPGSTSRPVPQWVSEPTPGPAIQPSSSPTPQGDDCYICRFRSVCGVRFNGYGRGRIVGSDRVQPGEWSWTVALMKPRAKRPFCGGTLISDRHILTAAHCVEGLQASGLRVRAGFVDLDAAHPSDNVEVEDITTHPQYNNHTLEADIAILRLRKSLTLSEFISVCCLPDKRDHAGLTGQATGWGTYARRGPSRYLTQTQVEVQTKAECAEFYEPSQIRITDNMVCASRRQQSSSNCVGDSGAPLVVENIRAKRWFVEGVLSWESAPCGRRPDVYVRVARFIDWIKEYTN